MNQRGFLSKFRRSGGPGPKDEKSAAVPPGQDAATTPASEPAAGGGPAPVAPASSRVTPSLRKVRVAAAARSEKAASESNPGGPGMFSRPPSPSRTSVRTVPGAALRRGEPAAAVPDQLPVAAAPPAAGEESHAVEARLEKILPKESHPSHRIAPRDLSPGERGGGTPALPAGLSEPAATAPEGDAAPLASVQSDNVLSRESHPSRRLNPSDVTKPNAEPAALAVESPVTDPAALSEADMAAVMRDDSAAAGAARAAGGSAARSKSRGRQEFSAARDRGGRSGLAVHRGPLQRGAGDKAATPDQDKSPPDAVGKSAKVRVQSRRRARQDSEAPRAEKPADAPAFDPRSLIDELGEDEMFSGAGAGGGPARGRAGFGGGGFGGGAGGRDALMAALAQRKRGGQDQPKVKWDRVTLFNPTKFNVLLNILFWPMHYLHWLLWPLLILSITLIYQQWQMFYRDIIAISWTWGIISSGVVSLLVCNLSARVAQGAVIQNFGGEVKQFGIVIELGVLPRFFVDRTAIPYLSRSGQIWAWGTPLAVRLWLIAIGTIVWATVHNSGNQLSMYIMVAVQAAIVELIIVGFPLMPDGSNFLAAIYGDPNTKKKSFAAMAAWLSGRPRPFFVTAEEEKGMIAFGIGWVLTIIIFIVGFMTWIGLMLESNYAGPGVAIFLVLCASCAAWLYYNMRYNERTPWVQVPPKGAAPAAGARLGAKPGHFAADEPQRNAVFAWGRLVWAVLCIFLLVVAFLPYKYETSGGFNILPAGLNQANARTDGEIFKILVKEGDWVEENQQLAQLSSWDQEHDVAVFRAKLSAAKANLAQLVDGAKPEAIAVAEKQVEAQRASVTYNKTQLDRMEELLKTGTIAQALFDKTKKTYDDDVTKLQAAVANLDLVRSAATQSQLDAAKADVEHMTAELSYKEDLLERTRVRAPAAGRVITPNLNLLIGKWLKSGEKLLEIENSKTVDAEIEVPETDVAIVKPGETVRIKSWGYSDREIPGKVVFIAPAADKKSYGRVVRVKATIPNEDGFLKSGMTGYAKIEAETMPTWYAFTRFVIRFFQVEVWSWIP